MFIRNCRCISTFAQFPMRIHICANFTTGMIGNKRWQIGNKRGHLLQSVKRHKKVINKSEPYEHILRRKILLLRENCMRNILFDKNMIKQISRDKRFPTMWYVRPVQQSLRSACANAQSDLSRSKLLEYSMTIRLLTKQHLEFLSWKGGCTSWSESTLVKMPHYWKSHVAAQIWMFLH